MLVRNFGAAAGVSPAALASFPTVRTLMASGAAVSLTNTSAETALATIVAPGNVMGPNGQLRVTADWSMTGNTNAKTMRIRATSLLGAVAYSRVVSASTGMTDAWQARITNRGAEGSQIINGSTSGGWASGTSSKTTLSLNTTVDQIFLITGQLASATDTLTLDNYTFELVRPPA